MFTATSCQLSAFPMMPAIFRLKGEISSDIITLAVRNLASRKSIKNSLSKVFNYTLFCMQLLKFIYEFPNRPKQRLPNSCFKWSQTGPLPESVAPMSHFNWLNVWVMQFTEGRLLIKAAAATSAAASSCKGLFKCHLWAHNPRLTWNLQTLLWGHLPPCKYASISVQSTCPKRLKMVKWTRRQ